MWESAASPEPAADSDTSVHNNLSSPVVPENPFLPVKTAGTRESVNPAELPSLKVGGCTPGTDVTFVTFCTTSGKDTK